MCGLCVYLCAHEEHVHMHVFVGTDACPYVCVHLEARIQPWVCCFSGAVYLIFEVSSFIALDHNN